MIPPLAELAEKFLLVWLALMAAVVGLRCIHGDINLAGLLAHDSSDLADARPAPERVQLLASFLFALIAYARLALDATQGANADLPVQLPEAPAGLVLLLAGSQSIYLTGKLGRALTRRRRP
ncbi:MAG TPA: hypothetical protein VG819_14275 [Rhizomicrobium sp.]|jgi:hypothetical protein|nr:hypothetical protein [Rhizomicrobium sp.]